MFNALNHQDIFGEGCSKEIIFLKILNYSLENNISLLVGGIQRYQGDDKSEYSFGSRDKKDRDNLRRGWAPEILSRVLIL